MTVVCIVTANPEYAVACVFSRINKVSKKFHRENPKIWSGIDLPLLLNKVNNNVGSLHDVFIFYFLCLLLFRNLRNQKYMKINLEKKKNSSHANKKRKNNFLDYNV